MIITIDGTSGVGKGTVARLLAARYGYWYMDTGLLFRRVAYRLREIQGDAGKEEDVLRALAGLSFHEEIPPAELRTEEISQLASQASTHKALREMLLQRQRAFAVASGNKVIFDGRDMGTVAFPDADRKIFLEASAEVRAKRRLKDLENQGIFGDYEDILHNIQDRDLRDATRAVAPTRAAADALVIDTGDLSIEDVFQQCVSFIEK